ncbi:hypothetical protein, partial [Streptomyces sp. NPDC048551]|uniref:hypothetical protein n=1 Tax=Streptomyces sp. NPDC048551 TaxID=3155758 RepID=UPI0034215935
MGNGPDGPRLGTPPGLGSRSRTTASVSGTEGPGRDMCSGSTIRYGTALHSGLPDGTYTVAWQAV